MKKVVLILIALLIFIIMSYFILNTLNNNLQKGPPICGDNICESSEESYCLDCNLSCKSELCNSKINVICDNCSMMQKELFPILLEHQTIAYDCLSDYYDYYPLRLIYHTISNINVPNESCSKKDGCYVSGGGFSERKGIKQGFISGLREYGKKEVTKKENVGFEMHELAHAFTYHSLGDVPPWFAEGISIYSESRLFCHPDYIPSDKIGEFLSLYRKPEIRNTTLNEIIPYDEYYKTKQNIHVVGAMYFGSLEQDYNCNKKCIAEILYSLHQYRENCIGDCFENAKKAIPQLINLSLNNKDLRIPIITNEIIKQKSEEVVEESLTSLFEMLEIEY